MTRQSMTKGVETFVQSVGSTMSPWKVDVLHAGTVVGRLVPNKKEET